TSSCSCDNGKRSYPDKQRGSARPSWPSPPVMRMRIARIVSPPGALSGVGLRLGDALAVLSLVVAAVVAGLDLLPPPAIVGVPEHRPVDGLVEAELGLPPERLELRAVHPVALVVALAVGDVVDQLVRLVEQVEDGARDVDVRA